MKKGRGDWKASDFPQILDKSRNGGTQPGSQMSPSGRTEGGLPFLLFHSLSRPPRERRCRRRGEIQREVEVAPALFLLFQLLVSQIPARPFHLLPHHPTPSLSKISGAFFGGGGGSAGSRPSLQSAPKSQTRRSQAVGRDSGRSLPAGTPPLPTSAPHSILRDQSLCISPS